MSLPQSPERDMLPSTRLRYDVRTFLKQSCDLLVNE
jgi:hypothetical protein